MQERRNLLIVIFGCALLVVNFWALMTPLFAASCTADCPGCDPDEVECSADPGQVCAATDTFGCITMENGEVVNSKRCCKKKEMF